MKAVTVDHGAVASAVAPQPRPGRGELLIRVCAAGLMLTELSWYPTSHRKTGEARSGAVPSHEFSGIVAAVGEDVGALEVGHPVFGMNDWYSDGALAEYCVAPYYAVAPKPARLSHVEAASVPIAALTAWQALFDHAKLHPGERVLIHGGAGSVGVFAIQLARLHGAHGIATASAHNLDFVSRLGAEQVMDYHKERFEDHAKQVDVVLDMVGGETLERSWSVLKPGGRMVTVASAAAGSSDPRVQKAFFIVEPNQKQLTEIAGLLDNGQLRTVVDTVIPLAQAPAAYAGRLPRQGRGKMVVSVANLN
ncbi:MAG TPA: NADP-dependent oxidoreductase [Bryobacteraceae bacterium]|nr:NADP-dependent oxidoreductase [Bryobacteraceae bacterium]